MVKLPSRKKAPKLVRTRNKKNKPSAQDKEDKKVKELSFDEIRALEQEFIELTRNKTKLELEEVRKQREEDELLGKTITIGEKIDLSEIETELSGKRGGLPEQLATLPEDHPLRARFEQGYRRRPDGSWYQFVERSAAEEISTQLKQSASLLLPILIVLIVIVFGLQRYNTSLSNIRTEIKETILNKGLSFDDPIVQDKYKQSLVTNWIPKLNEILKEIEKIPRSYAAFPDNPEKGSYIDHITKHSLPFDEKDAKEWYTNNIRKPAWQ